MLNQISVVDPQFEAYVDRLLVEAGGAGVALGVVKAGKVIYTKGFGYRDVEKKLPVTPDTIFSIGSVTKSFTSTLAGILVDRGKLSWDQPIRQVLPRFKMLHPTSTDSVNLIHMLSHQCGLPRYDFLWLLNPQFQRSDALHSIAYLAAYPNLGEKFLYNNLIYTVAGIAQESVTGKTWEELVQKEIFDPLQMKSSFTSYKDLLAQKDHALPYTAHPQGGPIRTQAFESVEAVGPAGSINSNLLDLSQYAILHLKEGAPLLSSQSFYKIHQKYNSISSDDLLSELFFKFFYPGENVYYQLGWFESKRHGLTYVEHSGGTNGYLSQIILIPEKEIAVIALCNHDRFPISFLAQDLCDHVLGKPHAELAEKNIKELIYALKRLAQGPNAKKDEILHLEEISEIQGSYQHAGNLFPFSIQYDQGALELVYPQGKFALCKKGKNLWGLNGDDLVCQLITFQWDQEKQGFYILPFLEPESSPKAFFQRSSKEVIL